MPTNLPTVCIILLHVQVHLFGWKSLLLLSRQCYNFKNMFANINRLLIQTNNKLSSVRAIFIVVSIGWWVNGWMGGCVKACVQNCISNSNQSVIPCTYDSYNSYPQVTLNWICPYIYSCTIVSSFLYHFSTRSCTTILSHSHSRSCSIFLCIDCFLVLTVHLSSVCELGRAQTNNFVWIKVYVFCQSISSPNHSVGWKTCASSACVFVDVRFTANQSSTVRHFCSKAHRLQHITQAL